MKTESDPFAQISAALVALPTLIERIETLETRVNVLEGRQKAPERPKQWYTLREAADALGTSPKSITRYIERGLLKKSLASRRILIPAEEIANFGGRVTLS
jgi:hypothetical protein